MRSNGAAGDAERVLHARRRWPGIAWSGVQVARSTRSTSAPVAPGPLEGLAAGLDGEPGGGAADAALADAGALDDPLVAGVERGLEVGVGDDLLGQGGAPAGERALESTRSIMRQPSGVNRAEPGHGLAAGEALAGDGEEAHHHARGTASGSPAPADVADDAARARSCSPSATSAGSKIAGGGADDEALGGEEVLAVVVVDGAGGGGGLERRRRGPSGRRRPATVRVGSGALGHAGEDRAGAELDEAW